MGESSVCIDMGGMVKKSESSPNHAALQGVVLTPLCSEAETSQNWCTHHRCVVHWGYNVSFNIVWSNEVIEDISLHYIPRRAHFSRNKRFPTLHPRRTQTLKLHQKLCVCVCLGVRVRVYVWVLIRTCIGAVSPAIARHQGQLPLQCQPATITTGAPGKTMESVAIPPTAA